METGIIIAVIAAVVNIIISLMNNVRLKSLEKEKRNNELYVYRYTKLYSLLEEVEDRHGRFNSYFDDTARTVKEAIEKRHTITGLQNLIQSLITDEMRYKNLELAISDESNKFKSLDYILHKKEFALERNINEDIVAWLNSFNMLTCEMKSAITKEIAAPWEK